MKLNRRKTALARLNAQLKSGVKNTNQGEVKLSDSDKTRINKEIGILEKRV
jgi:hypothetical protein